MAVVVSATVGISRVSADETNIVSYELDTKTEVNNAWLEANADNNLLKGCYVREVRNTGSYDTNNSAVKDRLNCINDNSIAINSVSTLDTGANPAYSFNPKKTIKVNKVLVSFDDPSNAKNFDVYFSQTEAVACEEGQTGAVFDREQNHISVTAQEGKKDYLLDLTSEQTCKYIIVEIFRGNSRTCNIAEIAAYGEEYKLDDFDQSFLDKNASKNIARGISVQERHDGQGNSTYTAMTDNNLSTSRVYESSSYVETIDYDLSFAYGRPVKQLILAYADGSAILDFDVYISNIYESPHTTSETYVNNIKSVTAVEGKKNYLIELVEPVMASRVVFHLKNPNITEISCKIAELGVYADDLDYIPNAVDRKDEYVANNYANILTNKNVKVTLEDTNSASLTDGKFDNGGCALTGAAGNYALTVDYELPEVFTFNKFMVAPIYGNLPQGVAIYVSETAQGLETAKPIEFTHNRSSKSILGKNQNKALEITLNSPVKAKFIRFKFTDAEGALFVSEIGAYSYADTNRDTDFNICDLVYINKNLRTDDVYADYNKDSTVDASDINALRSELLNK